MASWLRAIGAVGGGFIAVAGVAELGHIAAVPLTWLMAAGMVAAAAFVLLLLVYLVGAHEHLAKIAERHNKAVQYAAAACLLVAVGLFFAARGLTVQIPDRSVGPASSSPSASAAPPAGAVAASPALQPSTPPIASTPVPRAASTAHPQSTPPASIPVSPDPTSAPPAGLECKAATQSGHLCRNDVSVPVGHTMLLTTLTTALVGVVNGVVQVCLGAFWYDYLQRLASCGIAEFAVVPAGSAAPEQACGPSVTYSPDPIPLSRVPLGTMVCVENNGQYALLEVVALPNNQGLYVDIETL